MKDFLDRHNHRILGVINGFDRMRFRGSLREMAYAMGMFRYLWNIQVKLKHFKEHALSVSDKIKQATERIAEAAGRQMVYLPTYKICKEDVALKIAEEDQITEGLICVIRCVESCHSFVSVRVRHAGAERPAGRLRHQLGVSEVRASIDETQRMESIGGTREFGGRELEHPTRARPRHRRRFPVHSRSAGSICVREALTRCRSFPLPHLLGARELEGDRLPAVAWGGERPAACDLARVCFRGRWLSFAVILREFATQEADLLVLRDNLSFLLAIVRYRG
jgi:hypothetical protein